MKDIIMSNSLRTIATQIAITLVLAALAGTALFTFTDYATRGIIV